jgi:hypothetical protein
MPLPPLTTANAALQMVATLAKTLNKVRERIQASQDAELKILLNKLYDDFATLREAVQRVTDENAALRQPAVPASPKQKIVHLSHSKPVVRLLHLDADDCWRAGERKAYGTQVNCAAILLPVFFDPRRSDPGTFIENARSSLVFTDNASGQEYPVAHACWIDGTNLYFLDIKQGDTIYILLAILSENGPATLSNNKTDYNWYRDNSPKASFDNQELPLGVYKLEVVIQWGSNRREMFELPIDLNELSKLQSNSSAKLLP